MTDDTHGHLVSEDSGLDRGDWFLLGVAYGVMATAFFFWLLETAQTPPEGTVPLALLP